MCCLNGGQKSSGSCDLFWQVQLAMAVESMGINDVELDLIPTAEGQK